MSSRAVLLAVLVLLLAVLAVTVVVATPWRALPATMSPPDVRSDFGVAEIAAENAFHRAVRPPAYVSMGLSLLVTLLLGLTPIGARVVAVAAFPLGGGWMWRVVMGSLALTAIGRMVVLPLDAAAEAARRRYGLSTQQWGPWLVDAAKSFGLGLVVMWVALLAVYGLVRWSPQWWWTVGAAGAAALVVVLSFGYPVVVEPVFNRFTPMPAGPLRTSLLMMATQDHVPVRDVLVADASRRTTALNAYVSGFGATRRIVVYDTLLDQASPAEVRLVVAHELGHAKRQDVLSSTALGAVGAAALVCFLAWALGSAGLLRRAGVSSLGDPRSMALLLAVASVCGAVTGPVQALVSRRIETRADVHALDVVGDPTTFVAMQRRLAVTNRSDLDPSPLVFGLFATHPCAPQRIGLARDWARLHGVAVPPGLVR